MNTPLLGFPLDAISLALKTTVVCAEAWPTVRSQKWALIPSWAARAFVSFGSGEWSKNMHTPHTLDVEERESEWLDFCPNREEGSSPGKVLGDAKLTRYALVDLG